MASRSRFSKIRATTAEENSQVSRVRGKNRFRREGLPCADFSGFSLPTEGDDATVPAHTTK